MSSEITELKKSITGYEQSRKSAERFIALVDKYDKFDTLTNTMLNEFVEKIVVHERDRKGSIDANQDVDIYFNFIGRYVPPNFKKADLTPEEQEALRKKEERRERLHQNYLRRKASQLNDADKARFDKLMDLMGETEHIKSVHTK